MTTLNEVKSMLAEKKAEYHELHDTLTPPQLRARSVDIEALQKMMSDLITSGAEPCPRCGTKPVGMIQPGNGGRSDEYEVGCTVCPPFKHHDGSFRDHRVRGGLLPSHAVEVWNAGADHWLKTKATHIAVHGEPKLGPLPKVAASE